MSPSPQSPDAQELAGQIDAIRADIQSLTSTVSRIAATTRETPAAIRASAHGPVLP